MYGLPGKFSSKFYTINFAIIIGLYDDTPYSPILTIKLLHLAIFVDLKQHFIDNLIPSLRYACEMFFSIRIRIIIL